MALENFNYWMILATNGRLVENKMRKTRCVDQKTEVYKSADRADNPLLPLWRIVHHEVVEKPNSRIRQPGERVTHVVVTAIKSQVQKHHVAIIHYIINVYCTYAIKIVYFHDYQDCRWNIDDTVLLMLSLNCLKYQYFYKLKSLRISQKLFWFLQYFLCIFNGL